jgi:hypothetical protein
MYSGTILICYGAQIDFILKMLTSTCQLTFLFEYFGLNIYPELHVNRAKMKRNKFLNNPRNGSWTSVSVRFCGFLPRRDDDADYILLGGATTAGSRKNGQSRL